MNVSGTFPLSALLGLPGGMSEKLYPAQPSGTPGWITSGTQFVPITVQDVDGFPVTSVKATFRTLELIRTPAFSNDSSVLSNRQAAPFGAWSQVKWNEAGLVFVSIQTASSKLATPS